MRSVHSHVLSSYRGYLVCINIMTTHRLDSSCISFVAKLFINLLTKVSSMIGDVNIFLADGIAELEIMVAETSFRGQGIGTEAAEMMIKYSVKFLHITKFQVKIVEDNISSIGLFKKLGFEIYSYSAVFKEHTLFLKANALEKIISGKCLKVELYGRGD